MRRIVVIGVAVLGLMAVAGCASMRGPQSIEDRIGTSLTKWSGRQSDPSVASILVHSPELGLDVFARADESQPAAFHGASAGKLFTTTVIGMLIDTGQIDLGTRVAGLLPGGYLDGLFVIDGIDFQNEVTVQHLLAHTSGVGDYFGDPAAGGQTMFERMVAQPYEMWTPELLLEFARRENVAIARPGETYHYSDTGFLLLGLLAEAVTGRRYEEIVSTDILEPLAMSSTWMPKRTTPANNQTSMRQAWVSSVDVSGFTSISADWSGGGIASTERDLLIFSRALWGGELVSRDTLESFLAFDNTFERGILYGLGIMELSFGELSRLMSSFPSMVGHMGVLGTQVFYEPERDLTIIINLGSDDAIEDSVRLLIEVLSIVLRAR